MSPLGCGTWAWGNRFLWGYSTNEDEEIRRAYDYLISKGVNWFDTADSYGTGSLSGRAEELLGKFDSSSSPSSLVDSRKKRVYMCTKLAPYPWRIGDQAMKSAAKESLSRLQRPSIDLLQLHWPPSLQWQETTYLSSFIDLVAEKKALQIGVSNYGPKNLERIMKIMNQKGAKIITNQVQFSLLSRGPLTNGLTQLCADSKIQLIGYSPLALGLLTDKYTVDKLPKGPRGLLFREYLPVMAPLLNELRDIAKFRKKTVAQVALNWNMQKGFLTLVGIRSLQQAKDNLGALGWSLTTAEVEAIDRAADKVPKQLIQNSFQNA